MNKKKPTHKRLKSYQQELLTALQNTDEAIAYLNAALMDEDPRIFLIALKNVLEAQGGSMIDIAEKADLNREHLYRLLSKKGNPKISSVSALLQSVGLHLSVQSANK